jgi:hypothetical protein
LTEHGKRTLSRRFILLSTGGFALLVRAVVFAGYLSNPFRHFHRVQGLDMETLLRFSEWAPGNEFFPLFVVHRFLIYLTWLFNGKEHCIPAVIFLQCLFGIAGAILTADLVLMLWGKRKIALAAGLFYGLYPVILLYDFCILQESVTTTLILLGVWSYFKCRSRHFPSKRTFFSGILLGLCSVGRPVAAILSVILPVKTFFDGKRRAAFLLLGGVCVLWLGASTFNKVCTYKFSPFFSAMNYTVSFHAEKAAASAGNAPQVPHSGLKRMISGLPGRTAQFFLAYEMPENINFYFLRHRLFPLKFLPGPGILLPLALAGIFLMLPRLKHREGLLLGIILLLALPLAAREPLGRYRLHLIPYFVLCAAYFFIVLTRNTRRTNFLCGGAYAAALAVNFCFGQPAAIRISDHVAWGKAIEVKNNGNPSAESLREFFLAWTRSGETDRAAAVNLITSSLRAGNMKLALQTIDQGIAGPAKEKSIFHYYKALLLISNHRFAAAEKELAQIKENEIPHLKKKIHTLQQVVQRKSF